MSDLLVGLSAQMEPFMASINCLDIVVPKPVPPYSLVVDPSTCVKLSNILSSLSFGIPIPVSLMLNHSFG